MENFRIQSPSLVEASELHPSTFGLYLSEYARLDAISSVDPDCNGKVKSAEIKDTISRARHYLDDIDEHYEDHFDGLFEIFVPSFVKQGYKESYEKGNLSTKRDWLVSEATDEQLANVAQHHIYAQSSLQRAPEVKEAIENQKEQFKNRVSAAVTNGWLHTDALLSVAKSDEVNIYIGDAFDTVYKGRSGYHDPEKNEIVVAGRYGHKTGLKETTNNINNALKHELSHAVFTGFKEIWLNEAITEHIAQSLESGQENSLLPACRKRDPGVYASERNLLWQVLDGGLNKISVFDVTRSYTSVPAKNLQRDMHDKIDRSWRHVLPEGVSVTGFLENYVTYKQNRFIKKYKIDPRKARERAINGTSYRLAMDPVGLFDERVPALKNNTKPLITVGPL